MAEAVQPGLRILVGAGCFADADAALRILARLPDDLLASLGGVLVEDVDTLATCQIPHQRVVTPGGATILAPSLSQVRALLKADARAFERSLARIADTIGAGWVFAQDTGELVGTALRAATGWDILVIGHRQVHQIPGKIIVLETANHPSVAATEVSDRLSKHLSTRRIVFSVGGDSDQKGAVRSSDRLQYDTLDQALKALTRTNAQAVLVDLMNGPIQDPGDLARLLEVARCPLVLFGTSGMNALLQHSTQIPPVPVSN